MALNKEKVLVIVCLLGIGMGGILLTVRQDLLYAQNQQPNIQNQAPVILVAPTDSIESTLRNCCEPIAPLPAAAKTLLSPADANAAVTRNLQLKMNLGWTFGQKAQRGWYIYEPLIGHLINTKAAAGSVEFAGALARWQESARLIPNGILDEDVLFLIIKEWQSERLKGVGMASANELLTAPPIDFWSQARPEELRRVERATYAAYKRMVAAAAADKSLNLAKKPDGSLADSEPYLKIISAYRSPEYQAKLRRETPNSGRAGLATRSPHFTGRALDIYVGGEPVETEDANRTVQINTPVYKWLVKNAAKFGFKPYFYEPWHWEYTPTAATTGESTRK